MEKNQSPILKALEGIIGSWREPIPKRFFRTFSGRPFERCDYCNESLFDPDKRYMINKYYSEGDLRQETAQCFECRQELKGLDSQESTNSINQIFSTVQKQQRMELASDSSIDRSKALTESCLICGTSKQETSIYFEYAYCEGTEIVYLIHPIMICGNCSINIYDSLSEQTKEHRNRFYEKHFGPPPDINSDKVYEYLFNTINLSK